METKMGCLLKSKVNLENKELLEIKNMTGN